MTYECPTCHHQYGSGEVIRPPEKLPCHDGWHFWLWMTPEAAQDMRAQMQRGFPALCADIRFGETLNAAGERDVWIAWEKLPRLARRTTTGLAPHPA